MLNAQQMRALPLCFTLIADPRRAQGRRHRLAVVLAIAAGAILCGMRGYKAISDWADALGQKARERFGCRRENGHYLVPSEFVIRDCLVRIEPGALDRALNAWNKKQKGDRFIYLETHAAPEGSSAVCREIDFRSSCRVSFRPAPRSGQYR